VAFCFVLPCNIMSRRVYFGMTCITYVVWPCWPIVGLRGNVKPSSIAACTECACNEYSVCDWRSFIFVRVCFGLHSKIVRGVITLNPPVAGPGSSSPVLGRVLPIVGLEVAIEAYRLSTIQPLWAVSLVSAVFLSFVVLFFR